MKPDKIKSDKMKSDKMKPDKIKPDKRRKSEMFSKALWEYARRQYDSRLPFMGYLKNEIRRNMEMCTPEEQLLMKFFYGTMPLRDMGEYGFDVFLAFVRHGLMLRENVEWCRRLPEEIFLHNVLYYRINSENIEDCRPFFYEQLWERIQGKTMTEAVLEINYWCAENGTYETSDFRTISPLTMYKAGAGRCGEESTFAVTAFRSVGIPARQVYTPKWAHCDDNHAWVEVYADGDWHFLGACEPEPVLDKGWFSNASSRTMMVHAREFSDYGNQESCFRQGELPCYNNVTFRYTKTRELEIKVEDSRGPASHARVYTELLNSAEYGSMAVLDTDEDGSAVLCTGMGTLHLWAAMGEKTAEALIDTRQQDKVLLTLTEEQAPAGVWRDIDIKAPEEQNLCKVTITREQKNQNRRRMQEAAALRAGRIRSYYKAELAEKYPEGQEFLRLAAGNFDQIFRFLAKDDNPDRAGLLRSLSRKDYLDARADVLEHHLQYAGTYRLEWEEKEKRELYEQYILCPRIFYEELTCYREEILKYFSQEEKRRFREQPETLWRYVREQTFYEEIYDYSTIFSTPLNTLQFRFGNPMSQKILCAAILRTLGVPARISQAEQEVEVYQGDKFVKISGTGEEQKAPERVTLTLKRKPEKDWIYYQNWTIGQFRQGRFITLDYQGLEFETLEQKLELEPGLYRIITANRLPGGDQLAAEYKFCLEPRLPQEAELRMRTGQPEELLVSRQLEDFDLKEDGHIINASALTAQGVHILAFLEPGEEPTEHVLNEMYQLRENFRALEAGICFAVREERIRKTPAWERLLKAVPEIKVVTGDFDELTEPLARRMYTDPEKLPLLFILNPGLKAVYAGSGYQAGSVNLLLELLKANGA